MMRNLLLILVTCIGLLLVSCSPQTSYSEYKDIANEKWHQDNILDFVYEVADTMQTYDMVLHLRHTDSYPYQNCWLFLNNNGAEDTIQFSVADQRGRWLGSGYGRAKEISVLYKQNVKIGAGKHHLYIQQGMREIELKGVKSIGLEVIKHGKE